jgi:hypothetical protein
MKTTSVVRGIAVALATLGMCLPTAVWAASPQTPPVIDVKLQDGGILYGQVVDPQGVALASVPVSLSANGKQLAAGATNAQGAFAFSGLNQGVYQVTAGQGAGAFRVWTANAAPPAVQQAAVVVSGEGVVRGQHSVGAILTHPLFIGAAIATAIAVPIAVASSDRDPASP